MLLSAIVRLAKIDIFGLPPGQKKLVFSVCIKKIVVVLVVRKHINYSQKREHHAQFIGEKVGDEKVLPSQSPTTPTSIMSSSRYCLFAFV